jgi:NTE family protein
MRGAYEVGVILGIVDALKPQPGSAPLFRIFSGASVGAINTAYLAANAELPDHGIGRLAEVWKTLKLEDHARVRPLGLTGFKLPALLSKAVPLGNSLLDTRALEILVRRTVDWERMHRVIDSGRVLALLIAALHVASGRTTMFTEHTPGINVVPTRDERRATVIGRITADHVLASAAIPLLMPTRRVGDHYYCDGGLRFNTPIAPAIRAGADRLIIVTVRHTRSVGEVASVEASGSGQGQDLSAVFLIGKLLNALLLDPVTYDLQVLERLNQMMEVLEQTLAPADLDRVQRVWVQSRGMPYKRLRTLVFTPSRDLGEMAGEFIRHHLRTEALKPIARYLIERAVRSAPQQEADWASYLLFDGDFATEIIAGGYADALARKDEIRDFYAAAD